MTLDVQADRERLLFRYEPPEALSAPLDVLLSKTEISSMKVSLWPDARTSEVHVHTSNDIVWFVVSGQMTLWDEKGEVIGEIGPEQGIAIPRGHAYRYVATPDPDKGFFETYRFSAADHPTAELEDDRIWLTGPLAGPDGVAALDAIDRSTRPPAVFTYDRPEVKTGKALEHITTTDRSIFAFQVLKDGGETNMHSHSHLDGFWFVRRGKARFYTGGADANIVLAELGPNEGVLIPKEYPYWFEAVIESDDDECELLQLEVSDRQIPELRKDRPFDRNDFVPPTADQLEFRATLRP